MTTAVAAPDAPARVYAALRLAARFWLWFLFKRVDVRHRERVPATGPVLLCANHPNNLIDSLLVGAVLPRPVHYLATAALFRNPLLARLLRAAGVIAVYRRQDDPDRMERNAEAFAACHAAWLEGRTIAIYPEGTTHAEARVQRIRTGAARLALGYEARRAETGRGAPLALIPVGLSFEARKSFRGRVLVSFGPPVPVTPYLEAYRRDPVAAVEALTAAIQWAMEAEVVHVERIETARIVRAVEELYRDHLLRELRDDRGLPERDVDVFRLSRTIADAVLWFRTREPERIERLWQRIQGYRAMLAAYRVRDEAVQARLRRPTARRRLLAPWQATLGFPVFVYGAAVNALPFLLPRWLARAVARRETDYATARLLATVVAVPLFWTLEIWTVARVAGPGWAALFALSLPVAGLLAYDYQRGLGRLRGDLRFSLLALTRTQAARALLAERQAIVAELDRARRDFLAGTRGSSF